MSLNGSQPMRETDTRTDDPNVLWKVLWERESWGLQNHGRGACDPARESVKSPEVGDT